MRREKSLDMEIVFESRKYSSLTIVWCPKLRRSNMDFVIKAHCLEIVLKSESWTWIVTWKGAISEELKRILIVGPCNLNVYIKISRTSFVQIWNQSLMWHSSPRASSQTWLVAREKYHRTSHTTENQIHGDISHVW